MAEERDLRQRVLDRAREHQIEDRIVESFLNLLDSDKIKPTDWPKIVEWLQPPPEKDAAAYGPPIVLDVDVEDMSRYTDAELRTMQAQLEWYLNGGADGDETKEQPSIAAPPDKPLSASNAPETSGGREAERKPPRKIDLKLEDYLHG